MLKIPPPKFVKRSRLPKSKGSALPTPPPVQALTLVAATYDPDIGPTLRLTFDCAIDIDALDGQQIVVDDNANLNLKFDAVGVATLESPTRVAITLEEIDVGTGEGITLDATTDSGIVAVDDGGTWDGVTELALPFP